MLQQRFYWGTIRKIVVAFGNLFNSIEIARLDEAGETVQQIKVPLAYANRQKFLARINQIKEDGAKPVQVVLPRMAFELIGIQYDPQRKLPNLSKIPADGTRASSQYVPATYLLSMNLYIYSRNQDDALQVIEQILPYFTPDFNITTKTIPALDIKHDTPVILRSVSFEDDYEGDFRDRRMILWTLSFDIHVNFYGPIAKEGVIKKVFVDTYNDPDMTNQLTGYSAAVDPESANADSAYTLIETFEDF